MRAILCLENEDAVRRIMWLSERKSGIYIGAFNQIVDVHASYHQDGTRHYRIGKGHHQRWKDIPLHSFCGAKQLQHSANSLPPDELGGPRHVASPRDETVFIPAIETRGFDSLAIDFWLADRTSMDFVERLMAGVHCRKGSAVVAERVWSLQSFPQLHVALSVSVTNVADRGETGVSPNNSSKPTPLRGAA